MYRQGLGDCFLLTFPRRDGEFHMLIDCGVFRGTKNQQQIMRDVAEDIKTVTGGRLNLVVATHEHWDHLSGFAQARDVFDNIQIDAVWFAWTEDPNNELAREMHGIRAERLRSLLTALNRLPDARFEKYKEGITELLGFFGEKLSAAGDETRAALDYVSKRGEEPPSYCYPGQPPLSLDGVNGVRIYVLGPPEDKQLIGRSKPSRRNSEVYDKFFNLTNEDSFFAAVQEQPGMGRYEQIGSRCYPFDSNLRVSDQTASSDEFFVKNYGVGVSDDPSAWRKIDDDWLTVAGEIALHLDNDTNNTSLVLAIEMIDSGKVLLFPGDAQVGNWLSWDALSWAVDDERGKPQVVTSRDLLARTVLYKVGHHGSHNATLREKGLELMTSPDLVAMIPVDEAKAAKTGTGWSMPFPALLKRLTERTRGRIIRADAGDLSQAEADARELLTEAEWKKFQQATKVTHLYVDHVISF